MTARHSWMIASPPGILDSASVSISIPQASIAWMACLVTAYFLCASGARTLSAQEYRASSPIRSHDVSKATLESQTPAGRSTRALTAAPASERRVEMSTGVDRLLNPDARQVERLQQHEQLQQNSPPPVASQPQQVPRIENPFRTQRQHPQEKLAANQPESHRASAQTSSAVSSQPSPTTVDLQVRVARYETDVDNQKDLRPVINILDSIQGRLDQTPATAAPETSSSGLAPNRQDGPSAIARTASAADLLAAANAKPKPIDSADTQETNSNPTFTDLIERITYCTLIVLSLGIGFIVVAKAWQAKQDSTAKTEVDAELKVLHQITLAPKVSLILVEAGQQKMVVATDPTGVKSVIPLDGDGASGLTRQLAANESEGSSSSTGRAQSATATFDSILDEFTRAEPKDATIDGEGRYTLSSIVQTRPSQSASGSLEPERSRVGSRHTKTPRETKPKQSAKPNDEAHQKLQEEMEAALVDAGLKDLIMKSLQQTR